MKQLMLLGTAALLATSAMAVAQSTPAPDMGASTPAAPNDATTAAAPTSAPAPAMNNTAAADPSSMPSAPQAAPANQVASGGAPVTAVNPDAAAKVNADWAKYDEGNKGKLTPLEFGNWILASKGQDQTAKVEKTEHSKAPHLAAVKVLNETATDFAKADTDKDHAISPNELAAFLSA